MPLALAIVVLLGLVIAPAQQSLVDSLTLEQQVAQMFMVTVHGSVLPEVGHDFLQRWQPGAIVLFTSNADPPAALTHLTNSYQQALVDVGAPPLLIAVDQEGGVAQRLYQGMTVLPVPLLLTAAHDEALARQMGGLVAEELRAVGVNMNLAPVADLLTNPDNPILGRRTYGSDPQLTGQTISALIEGMQSGGVLATLKHFPGHGDTSDDSHTELPVLNLSRERLESTELVPFKMGIEAGAQAVMVAHIWFSALEPQPDLPASLSSKVVTGLLRQEIGFQGLIMTDALDMDAIDRRFSYPRAAVMAVQAGADLLAMGPGIGFETQAEMMQTVIDAVHQGEISPERIRESAARILAVKAQYGILDWQPLDENSTTARLNLETHQTLVDSLFPAGITVAYDHSDLLPLREDRSVALVYLATHMSIRAYCSTYRSDIRWVGVSQHPTAEEIGWAQDAAQQADTVVVFTENAVDNTAQQNLVRALLPEKTAVVALSSPYDWRTFPDVAAYALTYSPLPPAIPAACAMLFGAAPARGILPVMLSPDLPAGSASQ